MVKKGKIMYQSQPFLLGVRKDGSASENSSTSLVGQSR